MEVKNVVIGVIVVLLLVVIIRWITSSKHKLSGLTDAKKVTKIEASNIESSNSTNFAYSLWFYVNDWSYRYGEPKIVLGRLDNNLEPSPSIVLGAIQNNIQVQTAVYPSAESSKATVHKCSVANIPIQRWVNLTVSLYGRTLDIYINGKLVRTCVLPGVAKVSNNAPIYITPLGGFDGYTANVNYYTDPLNPQEAYNIYRRGYGGTGLNFPYSLKVEFLKDGEEQGSIEI
jgi:hypothetical protein